MRLDTWCSRTDVQHFLRAEKEEGGGGCGKSDGDCGVGWCCVVWSLVGKEVAVVEKAMRTVE